MKEENNWFLKEEIEVITICWPIPGLGFVNKVSYQYKPISKTWFILIEGKIWEKDEFVDYDLNTMEEWSKKFDSSLCFLKDESLIRLDNPHILYDKSRETLFYEDPANWYDLPPDNWDDI